MGAGGSSPDRKLGGGGSHFQRVCAQEGYCVWDGLSHYTTMLSHAHSCASLSFILYCFHLSLTS
jgi:hypothetical protein